MPVNNVGISQASQSQGFICIGPIVNLQDSYAPINVMPHYPLYGQDTDRIRGTDDKSVPHTGDFATLMAELCDKWELICLACFDNNSRKESY